MSRDLKCVFSVMEHDVRWKQRFANFEKALSKLEASVEYIQSIHVDVEKEQLVLDDLIKQGLIQSFEFTHELAWNVIKDISIYQGNPDIKGSRDATREGFSMGLIEDGDVWMDMIRSRNLSSHTYDESTAKALFDKIQNNYLPAFLAFNERIERMRREQP